MWETRHASRLSFLIVLLTWWSWRCWCYCWGLLGLAEDEKKHARIIGEIQSQMPEMQETTILDSAKNVFQQMKDFGGELDLTGDEEKMYREAMVMEQRSVDFYLDRAEQIKNPDQKELFRQLAKEEKKHYRLLENVADFVARPKTYLANAEFSNLEEF